MLYARSCYEMRLYLSNQFSPRLLHVLDSFKEWNRIALYFSIQSFDCIKCDHSFSLLIFLIL